MKRLLLFILLAFCTIQCFAQEAIVVSNANRGSYPKNSIPEGATAVCRDGTYSFSWHRQGTCSHHGGVAKWLQ